MKNIYKLIILSLLLIGDTLYCRDAYSKIIKKVDKDGNLYFYNVPSKEKYKRRPKLKSKYDSQINRISKDNKVDPFLMKCIIKVESNFDQDAVSEAGAMGLMQLMQQTARLYNVNNPLNPENNLNAGIKHFKQLLIYFKNDISLALAAYHAGIGAVKKRMKLPPIKSTIRYVKKIMILYRGEFNSTKKVNRLYKRIGRDGTIFIYSK